MGFQGPLWGDRRPAAGLQRSSGGGLVDDEAEDAPLFGGGGGGGGGGNLDSIFARLENVRPPSLLCAASVPRMFLFTLLCAHSQAG